MHYSGSRDVTDNGPLLENTHLKKKDFNKSGEIHKGVYYSFVLLIQFPVKRRACVRRTPITHMRVYVRFGQVLPTAADSLYRAHGL